MRGDDEQQLDVFSYVSPEQRIPQEHPLRMFTFTAAAYNLVRLRNLMRSSPQFQCV
jgi:hypothetical protein